MLAIGRRDGRTRLIHAATGETRWEVQTAWCAPRKHGQVSQNPVAISPDGRFVACVDEGPACDKPVLRDAHSSSVCMATVSHDGRGMCICQQDTEGRLWVQASCPVQAHASGITVIKFSQCGLMMASGDYSGKVILWDAQTGKAKFRMELMDYAAVGEGRFIPTFASSLSFSADGLRLVGMVTGWTVQVWETVNGTMLQCWDEGGWLQNRNDHMDATYSNTSHVASVQFWPGSCSVLAITSFGFSNRIDWWDLDSGKMIETNEESDTFVMGPLAFSIDGHKIAAVGDNSVVIFKYATPTVFELVSTILLRDHQIMQHNGVFPDFDSFLFSVDGTVIATTYRDGCVMLFDTLTGDRLRTVEQRQFLATRWSFEPCISSGSDWVRETLIPLAFMMGHHPRLGAQAHLLTLDEDLLRMVIKLT